MESFWHRQPIWLSFNSCRLTKLFFSSLRFFLHPFHKNQICKEGTQFVGNTEKRRVGTSLSLVLYLVCAVCASSFMFHSKIVQIKSKKFNVLWSCRKETKVKSCRTNKKVGHLDIVEYIRKSSVIHLCLCLVCVKS